MDTFGLYPCSPMLTKVPWVTFGMLAYNLRPAWEISARLSNGKAFIFQIKSTAVHVVHHVSFVLFCCVFFTEQVYLWQLRKFSGNFRKWKFPEISGNFHALKSISMGGNGNSLASNPFPWEEWKLGVSSLFEPSNHQELHLGQFPRPKAMVCRHHTCPKHPSFKRVTRPNSG